MTDSCSAGAEDPATGRVSQEAARVAGQLLDLTWRWYPRDIAGSLPLWRVEEDGPAVRGAVTTLLRGQLQEAVTRAWQHGWQPADLHRMARRKHKEPTVRELARGIRDELATYPRSTVDPRWWNQLEELPDPHAAPAPPRGQAEAPMNPVRAWQRDCAACVQARVMLNRLPVLKIIGPLPGEARHRATDVPTVDDKLLTKVRRLLAQAEGTPYEAEAETFTAAAQALMARHRIDRAVLEATDPTHRNTGPDAVRIGIDRPYEEPKMHLLHVICVANGCRGVWTQPAGFATVVGFESDRRAVELLYTSLLVQATAAMRREGDGQGRHGRSRRYRASFLMGFAAQIGQRLQGASTAEEALAVEAGTTTADSVALALRGREEDVSHRVQELFEGLVTSRSRGVRDYGAYVQGGAAADRANLAVGGRLTGTDG